MPDTCEFDTLDALLHELHEMGSLSPEYWDKQMHKVPRSTVVDRTAFLLSRCKDKTVLHIGCTGELDKQLLKVAKRCYGVDRNDSHRADYFKVELDQLAFNDGWPALDVDLILCGEVLEHLSNPGYFLAHLRAAYAVPVLFTVPNAFHDGGRAWLVEKGRENVNKDHVCYYSYTTLKQLLGRYNYTMRESYWYHGKPYTAEGLLVVAD